MQICLLKNGAALGCKMWRKIKSRFTMIAFAIFGIFAIEEDAVRSDVTGTIYNPIVNLWGISDSIWFHSALKNKSVFPSIKLKTLSVAHCSCKNRCAVYSFSYSFACFSACIILICLACPRDKTIIHNIWNYLLHDLIIWDSDPMISYIPLTWIIIHCKPWSNRFGVFSIDSKPNTIPISARLSVLFSPTYRSPLENILIKVSHIASFIKIS